MILIYTLISYHCKLLLKFKDAMIENKAVTRSHLILFALLLLVTLIYFLVTRIPIINESLVAFNGSLIRTMMKYGLLGSFFISIIGNSSLVLQVPYYPVIIIMGSQAPNLFYLTILSIVSGVGMMIGEVVSYYIGRGASYLIKGKVGSSRYRNINDMISKRPKLIPLLIFVFALSPLPDDLLIIPLGLIKYDVRKMILPSLFGKTILASVFSFGGYYAYSWIASYGSVGNIFDSSIFLLIFVLFIVYVAYGIQSKPE